MHGEAAEVVVRLARNGRDLVLSVEDNGKGFDVSAADNDGLGLCPMQYRAKLLGGELNCTSRPDKGTLVSCRFPISSLSSI